MDRTHLLHCICFSSLFISTCVPFAAQKAAPIATPLPGVILGALEDIPAEFGEPDLRAVRAIFQKQGDEWVAFPTQAQSYRDLQALRASYPEQLTWTVAFDGRNLGTVNAEALQVLRSNSQIGLEEITSDEPVPVVGEKSLAYSGFRITPVYRPLVALSQPNFRDSEMWQSTQLSPALISAARQLFRSRFPKASNCADSGGKPKPWSYLDEDIKVIKTYASNRQASLIELNLTGWACDSIADYGGPFHSQWYAADASGNLSFLGSDMWLVDAGDYDNDGSSELLFSIDGQNLAGYRLYYRNFTKSAEFVFYYQ